MGFVDPIAFVSMEFVVGALRVGILSLGLGFLASFVVVPFLVSPRFRSLFATGGPVDHWVGNYLLVMTVIGGGEIGLFAVTVNLIGIQYANPAVVEQLVQSVSIALFLGYVAVLWLVPIVFLPRLGIDWDDNGYDLRTIGLVSSAVLWYHIGMVLLSPYAFDWLAPVYRMF